MIIETDGSVSRAQLESIDFSHVTSVAVVGYPDSDDGYPSVEFASDLDLWTQRRVMALMMGSVNMQGIQDKMFQAFTANQNYLAIPAPTNAQVVAQVRLLTRECNALIKMISGVLDSQDGT